jgi:hypothetical protein
MTKREGILQAITAALSGTTGVSGRVFRSRVQAFNLAEHPSIVVEPVSDIADVETVGRISWRLTVQVSAFARSATPDQDLDPIIASLHALIMGDAPLQSLVVDVVPTALDYQFDDADQELCFAKAFYIITYQTSLTNLTTL